MATPGTPALLRLGLQLEAATLGWDVVGTIVLLIAALGRRFVPANPPNSGCSVRKTRARRIGA